MKRGTVALTMVLAIVASACQIKMDVGVHVEPDETGTFSLEIGLDEEFRRLAEGDDQFSLDGLDMPVPGGWVIEEFDDGEFAGTRISVAFDSFEELQHRLGDLEESGADETTTGLVDTFALTRDGDDYRFAAAITDLDDSLAQAGGSGDELGIDMTQILGDLFLIRFVVTLPGTIGDHNADEVDGNTLIWVIPLDGSDIEMFASSSTGSASSILPYAIGGMVVVAALLAFIGTRRRREPESFVVATGPPVEAAVEPAEVGADPFAP